MTRRGIVLALLVLAILPIDTQAQHRVLITPSGHGPTLESLGASFSIPSAVYVPPFRYWWDDIGTGDLSMCGGGSTADYWADGRIWFSGAAAGGGLTSSGIAVYEQGNIILTLPGYWVNSPDINGDRIVDLRDIAIFAQDLAQGYAFRSDFVPDGVINLSDIGILAMYNGETCP